MNAVHVHLVLNHLPVLGSIGVLLLLAWGLVRRSPDVTRAALAGTVLVALVTYPVFLSGQQAEERVENLSWAEEQRLEEHEERGEAALIAMLVTGAVAAFALWRGGRPREPSALMPRLVAVALVVNAGLFGWTALAGGQIRHDEIRPGAVLPANGDD